MIKKRREQCVVFLDDCFDGTLVHEKIAALGFVVERFSKHFPDRDNPKARQSKIKDAKVIALCLKQGYLMLTRDHEMKCTHVELLKGTDIAVVATANNHDHHDVWIEALKIAKPKILRDFKKYQRPYFSILQKNGTVITKTIGVERSTRRLRPKEQAANA